MIFFDNYQKNKKNYSEIFFDFFLIIEYFLIIFKTVNLFQKKIREKILGRTKKELEIHKKRIPLCKQKFLFCKLKPNSENPKNLKTDKVTIIPIPCNSYFCPTCAKKKKTILIERFKEHTKKHSWRFLTLTTVNDSDDYRKKLHDIEKAWNKLITIFRRKHNNLKFIKCVEIGNAGMVHIHALVNCYIPIAEIRSHWQRYTGAYIVQISMNKSKQKCINYLAAYSAKQTNDANINEKFYLSQKRRFSFSQNFGKLKIFKPDFFLFLDEIMPLSTIEMFKRHPEIFKRKYGLQLDFSLCLQHF